MLKAWPDAFRSGATSAKLRREAFGDETLLPAWLAVEVRRLPAAKLRRASIRRKRLEERVASLAADKPENWRAARANLLMRAALRGA
jgi:hypothetical protein